MKSWIFILAFAFATQASLVINEFDYGDKDFVEIYNSDNSVSYDLSLYKLVIVSGNQILFNLNLPSFTLLPETYFLICGNSQKIPKYASMCNWDLALTSAFVSQSSPSAVAIRNAGDIIIDTVSYKGAVNGWTELNSAGTDDNGYFVDVGFSRWPNGVDTNNNNIDFRLTCITPGSLNTNNTEDCGGKASNDNKSSSIGPTIGILAAIFLGVIFVLFVFFTLVNGIKNKVIRSSKGDDIEMASMKMKKGKKREKSKDESNFDLIHSGKSEVSGKSEIKTKKQETANKDELSSSSDSESESSSKRSRSNTQTSSSTSKSYLSSTSSGSETEEEEEKKKSPGEEPKRERKVSIYEEKKEVQEKSRKSSESSARALLRDPSKQSESEVDQSKETKEEEKKETKEERRERRLSRKSSSFAVVEPVKNQIQKSSSFDKENEKNEQGQGNSNSPVSSPTTERKEKKRPSGKQKRAKEYATVTRVQADRLIEKWETISTTSTEIGENKNSPKEAPK